ncbi:MAG: fumarylacetoacetate hydrolase family protein [candidate division Zixibacteria bacterium]|nr:fumarylacetoacetate hydrolase family protein [candidate division Zixibacteria bacterium]
MANKYYLRFRTDKYEGPGRVLDNKVHPINGDMFGGHLIEDRTYNLSEIKYLPPCVPQKIICVGLNYAEHAQESTLAEIPKEPVLFFKPPSALIGHMDNIVKPSWVDRVDYEGEIAAIIGRQMRYVSVDEARTGIFGYTCVNDVTARTIQKSDKQWTRGKGFDTFCPIGPHIVTGIDSSSLDIETRLNGKVVQESNTSLMMKSTTEVISYISKVMTLYPGDVISTGTPKGVGPVSAGDLIEIEIENIGILKNSVVDE